MNLTALALLGLATGVSQTPTLPAEAPIPVTNKRTFTIPVEVKPGRRPEIQRFQLWASRDNGGLWEIFDSQKSDAESLTFKDRGDGPYWVNMVIEYTNGRLQPPDVSRVAPAMKFIVDTVAPVVKITSATRNGEDLNVEWSIDDKNPNDAVTAVYVRSNATPDSQWQQAPPEAIQRRTAKFKTTITGGVVVMVVTADLARNAGSASKELPASTTAGYNPGPAPGPVSTTPPGSGNIDLSTPPSLSGAGATSGSGLPPFSGTPGSADSPPISPQNLGPITPPSVGTGAAPAGPTPEIQPPSLGPTPPLNTMPTPPRGIDPPPAASQNPVSTPPTFNPLERPAEQPLRTVNSGNDPLPRPGLQAAAATQPTPDTAPVQVIRTPRFDLAYQVDGGVSGVSKILLYVTRDDGRSWQFWSTHDGKETPLKVVLDTRWNREIEGDYGFKLVPVSGAGLSDAAPVPGTPPEMKVHVDMTPPTVEIYPPQPDPDNRNALVLVWKASDRNLARDPILIEYSETINGPWKSVTHGEPVGPTSTTVSNRLPNTGKYSWSIPATVTTPQVYLRVTAWDSGGNKTERVTEKPILVDLTRPRAKIQGIIGITSGR